MDADPESGTTPSPKLLSQLGRDDRHGRDEMNLAEFPITLLADSVPKDQKEAVYQDEIHDERTGRTLARKLTIQAGNYGLTTADDDDVILALIQLTRLKSNFTNPKVPFSRLELFETLGWPRSGASYERLLLSLDRWTSVYLKYENAWRDNRTKTWKTVGFHIIDKFELHDSRETDDRSDSIPSHIVWNEVIFESFQAGYLKALNYDLCVGLRHPTAKRMYRFLDKRFHHKPDWTFDLKELAHEHIGLGRHYEGPAHLKRKLLPAVLELEAVGFLEPLPEKERFLKDGRSWKVRLIQKACVPSSKAVAPPPPPPSPLVAELVNRGVTARTAADLVAQCPAEKIAAQIEAFDWLTGKKDKRIAKSPPGYLVKSIQVDYAAPEGFVPRAERDRKAEAARLREEAEADERRREAEAKNRARAEEQAADDFWKTLTAAQQKRVEAAALADADEEARKAFEAVKVPSARRLFLTTLRREYLVKRPREGKPLKRDG